MRLYSVRNCLAIGVVRRYCLGRPTLCFLETSGSKRLRSSSSLIRAIVLSWLPLTFLVSSDTDKLVSLQYERIVAARSVCSIHFTEFIPNTGINHSVSHI